MAIQNNKGIGGTVKLGVLPLPFSPWGVKETKQATLQRQLSSEELMQVE